MTTERVTPLTDLESDALTELANVAMAPAAVSLRTMIQHEVLLSVPNVEILAPKEAIARWRSRAIPIWSRCGRISAACSPDAPC
jgi:hypothetical protein